MVKKNVCRAAAFSALMITLGVSLAGSAQAAPSSPTAPKPASFSMSAPLIKLGRPMLEEYTQTNQGPVRRTLTPGEAQEVRATDDKNIVPVAPRKG